MSLLKSILLSIVILFSTQHPVSSAELTVKSVTGVGFGLNESDAIYDAVINGISQVNGESIASDMRMVKKSQSSTDKATSLSREVDQDISRKTKGNVKSWTKLSIKPSIGGGYSASAKVDVYVVAPSKQLQRKKIVVLPKEQSEYQQENSEFSDALLKNLTISRKFAMMDRQNEVAVRSELARIAQGGSVVDSMKLSAEIAPDFILTTSSSIKALAGSKSSITASVQVIDYATRQIKYFDSKSITFKSSDTSNPSKKIQQLAKMVSRALMENIYPPIIVAINEGEATIAQGSDFFSVGDNVIIKELGSEIVDPYTKEHLGYAQKEIGMGKVLSTDSRITKISVDVGLRLNDVLLSKKKYQASRKSADVSEIFSDVKSDASVNDVTKKNSDDDY